jgi:hypothetical protein
MYYRAICLEGRRETNQDYRSLALESNPEFHEHEAGALLFNGEVRTYDETLCSVVWLFYSAALTIVTGSKMDDPLSISGRDEKCMQNFNQKTLRDNTICEI